MVKMTDSFSCEVLKKQSEPHISTVHTTKECVKGKNCHMSNLKVPVENNLVKMWNSEPHFPEFLSCGRFFTLYRPATYIRCLKHVLKFDVDRNTWNKKISMTKYWIFAEIETHEEGALKSCCSSAVFSVEISLQNSTEML